MSTPRFAIYFVPPPGSRLAAFGASVLGYDGEAGVNARRIALPGIAEAEAMAMTGEPARHGFHATLKAPFALAPGRSVDELREALDSFASAHPSAAIGRLNVGDLGRFLALRPEGGTEEVDRLASNCVEAFDGFRAPPSEGDRKRRLAGKLSERQVELLDRWGYPHVFDQYRFHMTLAGPLPAERHRIWQVALSEAYGSLASEEAMVDSVALVQQDDGAGPGRFRVVHRSQLAG